MNTLAEFQEDMRRGQLWGATGIMTSGLVWLAAALVAYFDCPWNAIWTLFVGAAFIVPVSNLIDRAPGAPGKHAAGNRLAALAMETTVFMLLCLPLAYWLLGALLGFGALSAFKLGFPSHSSALVGAGMELVFGAVLLAAKRPKAR